MLSNEVNNNNNDSDNEYNFQEEENEPIKLQDYKAFAWI